MKITIYQNREVYKEESKIGNDSENKVETLEFEFPEEYKDFTKYIEFQIKGGKYVDLIENNKYVITREVAKCGKIKTQVVLKKNTENDVMIFKSDIFTLTVSNSINATESIIHEVGIDLIEKIVTKNSEQDARLDTLEADNTQNKAKILDLEAKNTEQDTNIQKNTDDIAEINQKDTTQDSLIEELQAENTKLKKEINSMQIPGEETGNPIHLTDSSDMECEIAVVGNSEQETREGYNLWNLGNKDNTSGDINFELGSGNYTISFIKKRIANSTISNTWIYRYGYIKFYDTNNTLLSTISDKTAIELTANQTSERQNISFNAPENTAKMVINFSNNNGDNNKNTEVIDIQLIKGTEEKPYEQYGAMPSPDYPSEIVTVGQNVNIFNILDYTATLKYTGEAQIFDSNNFRVVAKYSTDSNCMTMFRTIDLTNYAGKALTIQAIVKSNTDTNKAFIVLRQNNYDYSGTKSNELYDESQNTTDGVITLKYKVVDTINDNNRYLFMGFYATRGNNCNTGDYVDYKVKMVEGTEVGGYSPYGQGSVEIVVDNGLETTDTNYQSYTKVLPIQQEMLEGDYIEDVEHHEWGKAILSGNEDVIIDGTYSGITQFKIAILNVKKQSNPSEICVLSNYFLGVEWNNSWKKNNSIVNKSDNSVRIMTSKYTTIGGFKAWLKSKYDEGTPVIVYYKLATPKSLELTEDQKSVLNSFYTYKGITNISVDGIATLKVNYKKDLETIINNLSATSVAE